MTEVEAIRGFRRLVLEWFDENGRDLPWRATRDPYRILVSEVMLQQTQVSRVLPKYFEFLELFPNVESLSRASTGSVLRAWKGLGYNRRALYLKRAAEYIQAECGGRFPTDVSALEGLPGVGFYTARAIACFAFEAHVAVVETNVRRAIEWFVDPTLHTRVPESEVQRLASNLLPPGQVWRWNQAMIDFGALRVPPRPRKSLPERPTPRFEETDRFWRGRIVDVLRVAEEPLCLEAMLDRLPHEPDELRVRALLTALADEGLVRYEASSGRAELEG
jgi:A/G-specific adenine glycosylase